MLAIIAAVILGVVLLECVCFFRRFVLKKTGTQTRPMVGWGSRKFGIHHGSIGALVIAVYGVSQLPEKIRFWGLLIVGIVLLISDLIHHCFLKLIYGNWDPKDVSVPKKRSK